jgi:uncharacterized membrane protein
LFFTLQDLWLVLPFSGLEMLVLGVGLYLTSQKVYRKEVITLDRHYLCTEKGGNRVRRRWQFDTS